MALINLRNILLGYGDRYPLDHVNLSINEHERCCLVGRNGEGKSTLLKVIAGEIQADDGTLEMRQNLKIGYLGQQADLPLEGSVFDIAASGLDNIGQLLKQYHHLSHAIASDHDERSLTQLQKLQDQIELQEGWQFNQRIETVLSRLELDADAEYSKCSGGQRRRVMLARALVSEPDLLLLDEPTNHLDITSIEWLEEFLLGWQGSLLFVTHDRSFLRRLATRIVDLDRGQITSWDCDYETYLVRKQQALEAEQKANAEFDRKLAKEESWIRQGIKARRTRNEGRVRALLKMRDQRQQRKTLQGKARLEISATEYSGKLVIEADGLSYSYGDRQLVKDFSTTIMRGDRVGIIGANGVGKTTLIRLLLGQLEPDSGSVKHGTQLELAYFDQHRAELDNQKSVRDNLAEGTDQISINGRSKHVMSYLSDFLFSSERANSPVSTLSGGERNRLMLAKLFSKPFNLLVMDEPTNDLDIETLELLEDLLMEYQGTLLLVSHDREFIDHVVTSTLVFEGDGAINEYVGGYEDWLRQRAAVEIPESTPIEKPSPAKPAPAAKPRAKLSYKDQRELEALPDRIEALEQAIQQLHDRMADPAFYQQGGDAIAETREELETLEGDLNQAYQRWESLDSQ